MAAAAMAQVQIEKAPWLDRDDLGKEHEKIQTAPARNLSDFNFQGAKNQSWMKDEMGANFVNAGPINEHAKDQIPENLEMQVFISTGMPDGVLRSLFAQAAQMPKGSVRFVVRGFQPQKMGVLLTKLRSLFPNPEQDDFILDIDPNAFRAYSVQTVPVYLIKEGEGDPKTAKWFKTEGTQSLLGAKENVKNRGKELQGELYAIAEPDILSVIEDRAKNFDWEPVMRRAQARAAQNLKPSFDLPTSDVDRVTYHTPTFTVPHDIEAPGKDGKGKVLLAKGGQTINLMQYAKLQVPVIVFDPSDKRQSRMVKAWIQKPEYANADLFIVGTGLQAIDQRTPVTEEIASAFKRPVYPLIGRLNEKFGVQSVPSIVEQEGIRLKIKTFKPENF